MEFFYLRSIELELIIKSGTLILEIYIFENKTVEMQDLIEKYIDEIHQIQDKFNSLSENLLNEISGVEHDNGVKIQGLNQIFEKKHLVIKEKLDYLNAEIFRYGELLKREFNVIDLSGVMQERFVELKNAVSDYVSLKTADHQGAHDSNMLKIQSEHILNLNELVQKKELLIEEYQDKIELIINQFDSFKKESIDSKKNTCSPELLHQFDEASFENTVDEFTIGEKLIELDKTLTDKKISIPQLIKIKDTQNLVVFYNKDTSEIAEAISDVLLLRMLMSHLPDKLKMHIYDKNMNEKFREFLSIPDAVLSRGFDWNQFITHLNQCEAEIRSKLGRVWSDIDSDHQTLHQYNLKLVKEEKYDDIVSYFLFVFDDFLSFMNQHECVSALQRLNQLLQYGCNALLLVKVDDDFHKEKIPNLQNALKSLNFKSVDLTNEIDEVDDFVQAVQVKNIDVEHKKIIIQNFLYSFNNLESSRSKLKFTAYLVDKTENWFKGFASSEVKVPIGKSQQTAGYEYLSFKTKDMLSNALLCGGVGSGKTNFLKGVISSIALNYSPEEVEMWLIDMKNGAGFSVFHNCNLPHATKYAFSAESELINDIFYQLKKEMEDRYSYFAQFSVDNLEDASKLPEIDKLKFKRIILIIDEFATIFTEDAPYLDEISSNILSIIQKGRAMGINMLLAAQNFNNIRSSSFAQAVTLIPTRIVLKSSPEAAQSVLGSANHGSVEITQIGQGLINLNYGELNAGGGNRYFKSFLLDNEDIKPLIGSILEEVENRKISKPSVKFIDASMPANFSNNFGMFSKLMEDNYSSFYAKHGIECYLGETYLMSNDAHFSFNWKMNGRQFSQNVLITGNEREHVVQAVFGTLSSLSYCIPEAKFRINFLNALDADFSADLGLNKVSDKFINYDFLTFDENQIEALVNQLDCIIEQRRNSIERTPIITYIVGLEKLIKLHKKEYQESELTSKLKVLLSTGSSYGLYFVLEINKPSNLDKISRDLLGFMEHRICFTLNVDESNDLINNKAASKLIDMDNPVIRNKAIYYSLSEGNMFKFKSYSGIVDHPAFCREINEKVTSIAPLPEITSSAESSTEPGTSEVDTEILGIYGKDDLSKLSQFTIDDIDE